jgi:hypothetical protein
MIEVKRKDGGTTHCYGSLSNGDNYFIVTEDNSFIWADYDSAIHGKTWSKVINFLLTKYKWKVEQIELA